MVQVLGSQAFFDTYLTRSFSNTCLKTMENHGALCWNFELSRFHFVFFPEFRFNVLCDFVSTRCNFTPGLQVISQSIFGGWPVGWLADYISKPDDEGGFYS